MNHYADIETRVAAALAGLPGVRTFETSLRDVWYSDQDPGSGFAPGELPAVNLSLMPEQLPAVTVESAARQLSQDFPFEAYILTRAASAKLAKAAAAAIVADLEEQLNARRLSASGDLGDNTRVWGEIRTTITAYPSAQKQSLGVAHVRATIRRWIAL